MKISTYDFSVTYCVVNFDKATAKDLDNQVTRLKKIYSEELLHCIYPLRMIFNVKSEYADDDNLYITLHCPQLVTEDVINIERIKNHLQNKFAKYANGAFELREVYIKYLK